MITELKPSKQMWKYWKGDITELLIVSSIADRMGGFHISYSSNELLKDLNLITKAGRPNKKARELVAWYLHEKYHKSICPIKVINPNTIDVNKNGD